MLPNASLSFVPVTGKLILVRIDNLDEIADYLNLGLRESID